MNEDFNSINNDVNNELNSGLNSEVNNDFNNGINNDINNNINNEVNTTPIDHPINQPIERPEEPVVSEPPVNNKKGKNCLKAIVVLLVILVLGAVGYVLYSNGAFDKIIKETKTTETKVKNEEKKTNTEKEENQLIKVDTSKYNDNEVVELGTLKIGETEYKISYKRWNCKVGGGEGPDACYDHDYLTAFYVGDSEYNASKLSILYDGGLTEVAVLDNRYIFLNTGEVGDRQNGTYSMVLYDSQNEFKSVEDNSIYRAYDGYIEDNGKGKTVTRNIGYVDNNTFIYGTFEEISSDTECSQRYIEYTVKVKDGSFTKEKTFTKDGVQCSAQCS